MRLNRLYFQEIATVRYGRARVVRRNPHRLPLPLHLRHSIGNLAQTAQGRIQAFKQSQFSSPPALTVSENKNEIRIPLVFKYLAKKSTAQARQNK